MKRAAVAIAVAILLIGNVWQYIANQNLKRAINAKSSVPMVQLDAGVTRAEIIEGNINSIRTIGDTEGMPMDDIEYDSADSGAEVVGVLSLHSRTDGGRIKDARSDDVIDRVDAGDASYTDASDPYGYMTHVQVRNIEEPMGDASIPVGSIEFRAWDPAPWSVSIYPRDYSVTTALARNEDTGQIIAYSRMRVEANGRAVDMPIVESKIVENTSANWYWNPRLYLGAGAGSDLHLAPVTDVAIALSLASYGQSRALPTWSFAHLGVGYAPTHAASVGIVVPISYNVGKPLPLVDNLHIGPAVTVDGSRRVAFTLQLSAGL